jgi:hypothetical protein
MVRLALTGESITATALGNEISVKQKEVGHALRLFVKTAVLERNKNQYRLTERGLWLAKGLPAQPQSTPPVPPIVPPPKAAPPDQLSPGVVDRWLVERVGTLYPRDSRSVIRGLRQLILSNVLEVATADQSADTNERLQFSTDTFTHTTPAEREAIAVWQKIDFLLYGEELNPSQVVRDLGLRASTDIDEYAGRVIYRRLLQKLAKTS